jgi:uncharacterized lipoprotein YddW (UPF0748 family)
VERVYKEVHQIKPTIKVGIAPYGIWRPGNPSGVTGVDAYASNYADSRKWLQSGWVDYLAPQLYWAISPKQQSYTALLDWWLNQNTMGRHLWPGLAAYRVQDGTPSSFSLTEIPDQVRATRARKGGTGNFFFNSTWALTKNDLGNTLRFGFYLKPALVPGVPWLDAVAPGKPTLSFGSPRVTITAAPGEPARWWVIRTSNAGEWSTEIRQASNNSVYLPLGFDRIVVEAVDQAGNVSPSADLGRQ